MKKKVIVYFNSTIAHCSQIFSGLELLKERKEIDLVYKIDYASIPFNKLRIEYNSENLIFDMADDYLIDHELYNQCDFYIKRMLLRSDAEKLQKVLPFGLNYSVMLPNPFLKKIWHTKPSLLSYSIKYSFWISRLLRINDSIYNVHLSNMESEPGDNGRILFGTRLWDPQNNEVEWKKIERKKINNQRISIIRFLKEHYGNEFTGGIEESELSRILCPDILISKKESRKSNYLKILKQTSIGICNFGLEGSIGWKFSEYLANGIAVVSTPISEYIIHGELKEEVNYLSFMEIEDCIGSIQRLIDDSSLRKSIQKENYNYYQNYLHPEKKMKLIFDMIDQF